MPRIRFVSVCLLLLLFAPAASAQQATSGQPERPLNPTQELARERPEGKSLDAGPAQLRVGGYMGVTGIYRSTNSGGGAGTNFATIPYADVVQGNVSESRLSAQASRISIRVDADFPEGPRFRRLSGYFEMDFAGVTPGNVAVSASGVGFRLRHAFAEVQYGQHFFLAAGQAFSLMTAPKDQLSIWPGDVEVSQAVDLNLLAGMIWSRSPQLRLSWRPSTRINWGVSVENPEQQLGRDLITLPACCAADIDAQYNTGADELRAPNLMPDFSTRLAVSPNQVFHVDVGGVLRVFRHTVAPYDHDFTATGGGASVNVRVSPTRATKIIGQWAAGSGLGRYIGGLVPDAAFGSDGSISLIDTTSWVAGVEQSVTSHVSLGGYFSGVTSDASSSTDRDGRAIGFGYPGSANSNNRTIQEVTATGAYQIVRTSDRGSAQFNTQLSWLTREPLSVPVNGLSSARTWMLFAQVRYNLP